MLWECTYKQLIRRWDIRTRPLIATNHLCITVNCSFIFRRTWHSRHIGGSGQKVTFCPPTWYPYRFQKFEPHVFHSSPSAVCLECMVRTAVLEKSPVKGERRAQVRGWLQTRQRFSGIVWPIFVRFSPSGTEITRSKSDSVAFLKGRFFRRHVGCSMG